MYTYSMKKLYLRILELLFPSTEDQILLARATEAHFAQKYLYKERDGVRYLASFSDPQVKAAIHLNKFHKNTKARELLAILLLHYLSQLPQKSYVLIPIPLSSKRERTRGYNQVTIVVEKTLVSSILHITLETNVLKRIKHTKPQTSLTREGRHTNLKDAFIVYKKDELILKDAHIILLDDVTTTGATLNEAKAALFSCGAASITCVALTS